MGHTSRLVDTINDMARNVGYIYVLHYLNSKYGEDLIKVGRSDNPESRIKSIDGDLPGVITILGIYPVFEPNSTEKLIHRKYWQAKQVPQEAGPKAGQHEFFKHKKNKKEPRLNLRYVRGFLFLKSIGPKYLTKILALMIPVVLVYVMIMSIA